ncbi:MAG: cupin domain-containing protein [bacterium]|nr:cupin domain-containing protein [Betaproteobacteria bacterium]
MAITFNESSVAGEPFGAGVQRQRLLTEERVAGTRILLDRLSLGANSVAAVEIGPRSLGWFQMLEGEAALTDAAGAAVALGDSHVVFLPPGFRGTLASTGGARVLFAEVPSAADLDPSLASAPPPLRVIDWKREPVLDSEYDARKRIYLVTPKLFGTSAIKGEMIIYPPGTSAANHHHEGAEHFMYMLKGHGVAHANEEPFPVRAGDLVWFADRERHFFISDGDQDMVFVEFFAPGGYKTVWAPGASVCTWIATGRDIGGRAPVREIRSHSSADQESQVDV